MAQQTGGGRQEPPARALTDLIVDGNSLFARSWFASQKIATDEPIMAIGFAVKTVLNILHPDFNRLDLLFHRTLFAWDGEHTVKKNREPKPPEYHETRRTLQEVLTLMLGAAHCEHPDHEGDDIVATAVFNSLGQNEIFVVSGDKDLQQLQTPHVRFYSLNDKAVLSRQFICQKWHVKKPNQLAIALAIQGDSVDGIPGIHGYGPKKVQHLFGKVPKEAKFAEAIEVILAQIPVDKHEEFYSSLNRTLLSANVPDVPEPAEISMGDPLELMRLGLPNDVMLRYRAVYETYTREPW